MVSFHVHFYMFLSALLQRPYLLMFWDGNQLITFTGFRGLLACKELRLETPGTLIQA